MIGPLGFVVKRKKFFIPSPVAVAWVAWATIIDMAVRAPTQILWVLLMIPTMIGLAITFIFFLLTLTVVSLVDLYSRLRSRTHHSESSKNNHRQ